MFTIYCFIPVLVPFILSTSANNAVPHLSTIRPLDEERKGSDFPSFFGEYMVFFLPVYSITLTVLGLYLFGADVARQHFAFNVSFAGSFVVGLSSLAVMGYIRKSKQIDLLISFLWINMLSVLWVLLFYARIAGFMFPDNAVPIYSRQEIFISVILTCIPLLAHFLLTWLRSGARIIVVTPILFMCAVELAVGFPAFGGFVLREAGAGGGTPIDFIASQTGGDPQHGCLVLATSLYLYIEPTEAGKPCATLARMGFADSKQPPRRVNIFARDQVSFPLAHLTPSS